MQRCGAGGIDHKQRFGRIDRGVYSLDLGHHIGIKCQTTGSIHQHYIDKFELGFDLSLYTFLIDKSYQNDMCPSFYFKHNNHYFILWVDYADPICREEDYPRYSIISAVNDGDNLHPEIRTASQPTLQLEFEQPSDLIHYLEQIKQQLSAKVVSIR